MFTWGSKYLFGVYGAAHLAALAYGLITGGDFVGVLSLGYKGGVGDHAGYTMLMSVGFVALIVGVVTVITRDGDADDMAALVGSEDVLAVRPPAGPSIMAPLTAFGVACLALGVAISGAFLYLGLAVLGVVALEWMVQSWSDRATGDQEVNTVIRNRVIGPFQIPMLSMLAIAVIAIGLSRIFLTVSKTGATVVAVVAATFIFVSAILIVKARAPRAVISALVTFGAVIVIFGGILAAVNGERDFHHGEEDGEDHSEEGAAEGVGE